MAYFPSIAIGVPFFRAFDLIDPQAQAFYDRVIADGGANAVVPTGLIGVSATFKAVKAIYGVIDITQALSVFYDAHYLAYKKGTGVGTTAGQAIEKLYSACGASGDCVQTTLSNQPLLLAHNGVDNYWFSPQVNGNFCSAPNITIPTSSGFEIDVKVSFTSNDDSTNTTGWFVSHDTGSSPNRNIFFGFSGTRILTLYLNNLLLQATATTQFPAAFNGWFRVNATTVSANMEVKYFTSTDGITFTQLGTTITLLGGANCIKTTAIKLDVTGNNGTNTTAGKYFRTILKDANGVTRSDFNPATYNAATSQTQWTSTTGEVWTINTGTASTGYKGVLVDRTIVQGDGVDDTLLSGTLNATQPRTNYAAVRAFITSADTLFFDGNNFPPYQNLLRQYSGGTLEINSDGSVSMTSSSLINKMVTSIINSTSSTIRVNNGTVTTSSITGATLVALRLFRNGLGQYGMSSIRSFVLSKTDDNTTQQTAMYNFIKTLNNSAF
jgi:hypothetical protein